MQNNNFYNPALERLRKQAEQRRYEERMKKEAEKKNARSWRSPLDALNIAWWKDTITGGHFLRDANPLYQYYHRYINPDGGFGMGFLNMLESVGDAADILANLVKAPLAAAAQGENPINKTLDAYGLRGRGRYKVDFSEISNAMGARFGRCGTAATGTTAGTIAGAEAGASFGPIGAAVGAGIGAGIGAVVGTTYKDTVVSRTVTDMLGEYAADPFNAFEGYAKSVQYTKSTQFAQKGISNVQQLDDLADLTAPVPDSAQGFYEAIDEFAKSEIEFKAFLKGSQPLNIETMTDMAVLHAKDAATTTKGVNYKRMGALLKRYKKAYMRGDKKEFIKIMSELGFGKDGVTTKQLDEIYKVCLKDADLTRAYKVANFMARFEENYMKALWKGTPIGLVASGVKKGVILRKSLVTKQLENMNLTTKISDTYNKVLDYDKQINSIVDSMSKRDKQIEDAINNINVAYAENKPLKLKVNLAWNQYKKLKKEIEELYRNKHNVITPEIDEMIEAKWNEIKQLKADISKGWGEVKSVSEPLNKLYSDINDAQDELTMSFAQLKEISLERREAFNTINEYTKLKNKLNYYKSEMRVSKKLIEDSNYINYQTNAELNDIRIKDYYKDKPNYVDELFKGSNNEIKTKVENEIGTLYASGTSKESDVADALRFKLYSYNFKIDSTDEFYNLYSLRKKLNTIIANSKLNNKDDEYKHALKYVFNVMEDKVASDFIYDYIINPFSFNGDVNDALLLIDILVEESSKIIKEDNNYKFLEEFKGLLEKAKKANSPDKIYEDIEKVMDKLKEKYKSVSYDSIIKTKISDQKYYLRLARNMNKVAINGDIQSGFYKDAPDDIKEFITKYLSNELSEEELNLFKDKCTYLNTLKTTYEKAYNDFELDDTKSLEDIADKIKRYYNIDVDYDALKKNLDDIKAYEKEIAEANKRIAKLESSYDIMLKSESDYYKDSKDVIKLNQSKIKEIHNKILNKMIEVQTHHINKNVKQVSELIKDLSDTFSKSTQEIIEHAKDINEAIRFTIKTISDMQGAPTEDIIKVLDASEEFSKLTDLFDGKDMYDYTQKVLKNIDNAEDKGFSTTLKSKKNFLLSKYNTYKKTTYQQFLNDYNVLNSFDPQYRTGITTINIFDNDINHSMSNKSIKLDNVDKSILNRNIILHDIETSITDNNIPKTCDDILQYACVLPDGREINVIMPSMSYSAYHMSKFEAGEAKMKGLVFDMTKPNTIQRYNGVDYYIVNSRQDLFNYIYSNLKDNIIEIDGHRVLVTNGYNNRLFDDGLIVHGLNKYCNANIEGAASTDTMDMFKDYLVNDAMLHNPDLELDNFNLDAALSAFNIAVDGERHDAIHDVRLTKKVYDAINNARSSIRSIRYDYKKDYLNNFLVDVFDEDVIDDFTKRMYLKIVYGDYNSNAILGVFEDEIKTNKNKLLYSYFINNPESVASVYINDIIDTLGEDIRKLNKITGEAVTNRTEYVISNSLKENIKSLFTGLADLYNSDIRLIDRDKLTNLIELASSVDRTLDNLGYTANSFEDMFVNLQRTLDIQEHNLELVTYGDRLVELQLNNNYATDIVVSNYFSERLSNNVLEDISYILNPNNSTLGYETNSATGTVLCQIRNDKGLEYMFDDKKYGTSMKDLFDVLDMMDRYTALRLDIDNILREDNAVINNPNLATTMFNAIEGYYTEYPSLKKYYQNLLTDYNKDRSVSNLEKLKNFNKQSITNSFFGDKESYFNQTLEQLSSESRDKIVTKLKDYLEYIDNTLEQRVRFSSNFNVKEDMIFAPVPTSESFRRITYNALGADSETGLLNIYYTAKGVDSLTEGEQAFRNELDVELKSVLNIGNNIKKVINDQRKVVAGHKIPAGMVQMHYGKTISELNDEASFIGYKTIGASEDILNARLIRQAIFDDLGLSNNNYTPDPTIMQQNNSAIIKTARKITDLFGLSSDDVAKSIRSFGTGYNEAYKPTKDVFIAYFDKHLINNDEIKQLFDEIKDYAIKQNLDKADDIYSSYKAVFTDLYLKSIKDDEIPDTIGDAYLDHLESELKEFYKDVDPNDKTAYKTNLNLAHDKAKELTAYKINVELEIFDIQQRLNKLNTEVNNINTNKQLVIDNINDLKARKNNLLNEIGELNYLKNNYAQEAEDRLKYRIMDLEIRRDNIKEIIDTNQSQIDINNGIINYNKYVKRTNIEYNEYLKAIKDELIAKKEELLKSKQIKANVKTYHNMSILNNSYLNLFTDEKTGTVNYDLLYTYLKNNKSINVCAVFDSSRYQTNAIQEGKPIKVDAMEIQPLRINSPEDLQFVLEKGIGQDGSKAKCFLMDKNSMFSFRDKVGMKSSNRVYKYPTLNKLVQFRDFIREYILNPIKSLSLMNAAFTVTNAIEGFLKTTLSSDNPIELVGNYKQAITQHKYWSNMSEDIAKAVQGSPMWANKNQLDLLEHEYLLAKYLRDNKLQLSDLVEVVDKRKMYEKGDELGKFFGDNKSKKWLIDRQTARYKTSIKLSDFEEAVGHKLDRPSDKVNDAIKISTKSGVEYVDLSKLSVLSPNEFKAYAKILDDEYLERANKVLDLVENKWANDANIGAFGSESYLARKLEFNYVNDFIQQPAAAAEFQNIARSAELNLIGDNDKDNIVQQTYKKLLYSKWFPGKRNPFNLITPYTNLSINSNIETINRLALYNNCINKGYLNIDGQEIGAINKVLDAHFNYSNKSQLELSAELLVPFISFPIRTMMFWDDLLTEDPDMIRPFVKLMLCNWDEDSRNKYNLSRMTKGGIMLTPNLSMETGNSLYESMYLASAPYDVFRNRKINPLLGLGLEAISSGDNLNYRFGRLPLVSQAKAGINLAEHISNSNVRLYDIAPSIFNRVYQQRRYYYNNENRYNYRSAYSKLYYASGGQRWNPKSRTGNIPLIKYRANR